MGKKTKHLVVVHDNESNHQALYVDGEMMVSDSAIYGTDIANAAKGRKVHVSFVTVTMPETSQEFPKKFEKLMRWKPVFRDEK